MSGDASVKSSSMFACFLFVLGSCCVFESSKGDTELTADWSYETLDCRQSDSDASDEQDDMFLSHYLSGIMPGVPLQALQLMRAMVALVPRETPTPTSAEIQNAATAADSSIKGGSNER